MHPILYRQIQAEPDLLTFIRYHPIWYRYLMREPNRFEDMRQEAKVFHGQTFSQRVEKATNQVQMIHTIIQLTSAMKD